MLLHRSRLSAMFYKMFYGNVLEVVDINSAVLMTASVLVVGYVWTCLRASSRAQRMMLDLESKPHRVLLITAHPDDECMFFGPTVQKLTKMKDVRLYLMCMSVGNSFLLVIVVVVPHDKRLSSI